MVIDLIQTARCDDSPPRTRSFLARLLAFDGRAANLRRRGQHLAHACRVVLGVGLLVRALVHLDNLAHKLHQTGLIRPLQRRMLAREKQDKEEPKRLKKSHNNSHNQRKQNSKQSIPAESSRIRHSNYLENLRGTSALGRVLLQALGDNLDEASRELRRVFE